MSYYSIRILGKSSWLVSFSLSFVFLSSVMFFSTSSQRISTISSTEFTITFSAYLLSLQLLIWRSE